MSKHTWLEQAHGLVEMVGDTGSVNGKDFRIAVEVIEALLGLIESETCSYSANGVMDEQSSMHVKALRYVNRVAKANGR